MSSTICLNMIVKNESHIIKHTLDHLHSIFNFDYWVICDTGSTDNTKEVITTFFDNKGVSGELITHAWKGFDVCRSHALKTSFNKTDYVLIFDADDYIHGNFKIPEDRHLTKDMYYLRLNRYNTYYRPLLVNNRIKWIFKGVLHEYLINTEPLNKGILYIDGEYYIESGRSGSRSNNPNKYIEDARILEEAIRKETEDKGLRERYVYYCAQSFFDANMQKEAKHYYKKTLSQNNWEQEKYIACIRIGDIYNNLGEKEKAIMYWDGACQFDKTRLEGVERIIKHYYFKGEHNSVIYYYNKYRNVERITNNSSYLLLDNNAYNQIRYYACISAFYADKSCIGYTCCKYLITNKIPIDENNVVYNMSFYIKEIENDKNEIEKRQLVISIYNFVLRCISSNYKLANQIWGYIHRYLKIYADKLYYKGVEIMTSKDTLNKKYKNSKNILFYVGYSTEPWNLSLLSTKAVGGSEKAVAYLTEQLSLLLNTHKTNDDANVSWNIYIAGGVEEDIYNNRKIHYVPFEKLHMLIAETEFHTIVVSRYISFMELYPNFKTSQLYICAHDTTLYSYGCEISSKEIIQKWNHSITGCICLTGWHKETIINEFSLLKDKITIINNGINTSSICDEPIHYKQKDSFIYSSCTERGLDRLLELWTGIKECFPNATLHICTYNTFPRNHIEEQMKDIIDNDASITHYGKLATNELYKLMSRCEYWLYPTSFCETSCITSLEMMAHNVICLYYPLAGLTDTIGNYGIAIARDKEIDTLVLIDKNEEEKKTIREKAKKYAYESSWNNRAKSWLKRLNLLKDISKNEKLSYIEKRMFDLHEIYKMPVSHKRILDKISKVFTPKVIYDIGSHVLHWTTESQNIWKESNIYAFDAIKEVEPLYISKNINYHIGVLSNEDNKIVKFYENKENPAGNSYYREIGHARSNIIYPDNSFIEKKSLTLTTIVKHKDFPYPDLIKIDVQGSELDIIKGGLDIINRAKYLIVELQHIEYNKDAPLYYETINFLNSKGWILLESKFSDNGPDADYLFINTNYEKPKIWCFYNHSYFNVEMVSQYLYNQNIYNNEYYKIVITNDKDEIIKLSPVRITYVNNIYDDSIIKHFSNDKKCELSILQTEPLNLYSRLNSIINIHNKYPNIKIYDYSKSNLIILDKNNIHNHEYLPYNIQDEERQKLLEFNSNNEKIYDFGFIFVAPPRRKIVIDYLKQHGFTVNFISGFGDERDIEISKCKFLLNIHGQINVNINPTKEECSNIFEHIRCDRLLECGYNVLSETSYELDPEFINKYPNLTIIDYKDFFEKDIIIKALNGKLDNEYKNNRNNYYNVKTYIEHDKQYNSIEHFGLITNTDKVTHHEYHKIYDLFLKQFYNYNGCMLEIGLGTGVSLPMWKNVFQTAHIYGVDVRAQHYCSERCTIYNIDQSKEEDLNILFNNLIDKDLFFINDDGSHIPEHQLLTFNILFPLLIEGGIYIIEDIETSYWKKGVCYDYPTNYGYKNKNSLIEIFKDSIDIVNKEFISKNNINTKILHHEYIESVTFYRNCIIIRKNYNKEREYRFKHFL